MKILILEDRVQIAKLMTEYLTELGHDPSPCYDCSEAIHLLGYKTPPIFDRYIVDLNIRTYGLLDDEVKETQNGLRTGWIFLTKYVFLKDIDGVNKTIIFSDYAEQLRTYISTTNKQKKQEKQEKLWFEQLDNNGTIIHKCNGIHALDHLLTNY